MCTGLLHFGKETVDENHRPWKTETGGRYAVNETHMFDESARKEDVFCGADASGDEPMGVDSYLEMRNGGFGDRVGTVCEGCKIPAPQFAMELAQDLEAEGLLDEAEDYRQLARTLLEETGRNGQDR